MVFKTITSIMVLTIMIAIVIILIQVHEMVMSNSNFTSFIFGLVGGIIPPLSVSLLDRCSKPKLLVSEKIVERNGYYRFKIQNTSNRVITDINIHITYRTQQKGYYSYNENNIPILHGEKSGKTNFNNEVEIRFDNAKSLQHKPSKSNGRALEAEIIYETIKDFFLNNKDGKVELEISFCYKRWNNTVREFIRHSYENSSCISYNSKFPEGSLVPTSLQENHRSYLSS